MNKKLIRNIIVLTLAAVVLVTTTVFTTVAYLLSTAKVSNVFTVGNVSIEMYESPVTSDGEYVDGFNPLTDRKNADTNSYHILPGETYIKDPTVYIKAGSADTLLFVKARNQISNIETTEAGKTMKDQMEANGWRRVAQTSIGDWIYVYAGAALTDGVDATFGTIIPASNEEQKKDLFQTFTIDKACNEESYKLAQGAAVTITAYAIQGGTFHDDNNNVSKQNVVDAWNAIVSKVAYEAGNEILIENVVQ